MNEYTLIKNYELQAKIHASVRECRRHCHKILIMTLKVLLMENVCEFEIVYAIFLYALTLCMTW